MIRIFISAYTYFLSHKRWLIGSLFLLMTGLVFSFLHLEYKEDIAEFLPDNESNEQINAVYQHIGNSNRLFVNFSLTSSTSLTSAQAQIIEAIDDFTFRLQEKDSLHTIPEIIAQVDESQFLELTEFIQTNVPYFLTESDYRRIDSLLLQDGFVASQLREDKQLLMLPSGSMMKQNIVADPLHLFSPLLLKLKDFQAGNNEELNNGYIFSPDGRKGRVIITSPYGVSETAGNTGLLHLIDQTAEEVEQRFSGCENQLFRRACHCRNQCQSNKKRQHFSNYSFSCTDTCSVDLFFPKRAQPVSYFLFRAVRLAVCLRIDSGFQRQYFGYRHRYQFDIYRHCH